MKRSDFVMVSVLAVLLPQSAPAFNIGDVWEYEKRANFGICSNRYLKLPRPKGSCKFVVTSEVPRGVDTGYVFQVYLHDTLRSDPWIYMDTLVYGESSYLNDLFEMSCQPDTSYLSCSANECYLFEECRPPPVRCFPGGHCYRYEEAVTKTWTDAFGVVSFTNRLHTPGMCNHDFEARLLRHNGKDIRKHPVLVRSTLARISNRGRANPRQYGGCGTFDLKGRFNPTKSKEVNGLFISNREAPPKLY